MDEPALSRNGIFVVVSLNAGKATGPFSELFLVVDVAEMAWNLEIENKLAKQIESFVG